MMRPLKALVLAFAALALSAASRPVLTPQGLGAVRIGMTESAAARALGVRAFITSRPRAEDPVLFDACHEGRVAARPGVYFLFEDGKLARISLMDEARVKTDHGLGLGATEAQVRAVYPVGLSATPHAYQRPPALYLTVFAGGRGVRYVTNEQRIVEAIHAGGDAIELIEGCA